MPAAGLHVSREPGPAGRGTRTAKIYPGAGEGQRMNMGSECQIQANLTCLFPCWNEVVTNTHDPEIQIALED